jgi:hypothetical protein
VLNTAEREQVEPNCAMLVSVWLEQLNDAHDADSYQEREHDAHHHPAHGPTYAVFVG